MYDSDGCFGAVILPAAQGVITGGIVGLATLGATRQLWGEGYGWASLALAAFGAGWVYLSGVQAWRRAQYSDQAPERPYVPAEHSTVRVIVSEGSRLTPVDLPISEGQLREFAQGVVDGRPLSEVQWTGRGRTFLKPDFVALRDEMLRRGWVSWVSPGTPARGVQPTRAGLRVFQYLSTYPTEEDGSQK